MDKETIIKGCENWVNNHKDENLLLTYSSVVELLALLKEQEAQIKNRDESLEKAREEIKWLRGMLKEQEAVEPILYHRSDGTIFKYECRQCRTKIFKMDLFCRHCGRSVKWE